MSSYTRRFLVLGTGDRAARLYEAWRQTGPAEWNLLGFIGHSADHRVAPVLGPPARLLELVRANQATDLVLALEDGLPGDCGGQLSRILDAGVKVVPVLSFFGDLTGRVPGAHVGEVREAFLGSGARGKMFLLVKRALDLSVALAGLSVLAVLYLPFALALKRAGSGPLFQFDERVGRYGRRFRKLSLRTEFAGSARASRLGAILRRFRLDKLPVFFNILKGEMSMVGPRAQPPEVAERLQREIPFSGVRMLVRPGITGWTQLRSREDIRCAADPFRRVEYDLFYVHRASISLDLRIAWETCAAFAADF